MDGENINYHGTHLWASAVVLSAVVQKLGICRDKKVLELGCGCGLPGLVAAQEAELVVFTDGFESGLLSAQKALEINQTVAKTEVKRLKWGDKEVLQNMNRIDIVLVADCLYPDVSSWNDFFLTVVEILKKNESSKCLLAFHKRSTSVQLDPFFAYWKLNARVLPLSHFELDLEDDIGGTRLPGNNTGSIIIYEITSSLLQT
ncbi:Oidioi.mRNA.OKI2018_I69.PAR.g10884.t1.cds [Oikopleura dioica]|uniref:Oidioi.mRNA.OKI2018_I69.PAR.g10884.t1.cds n=1 Tax=Oikopleura dioica TaxID=34765 RepID=A0ABN7RYB8_OIKDI|nr:Oidioi.mRNA.OKI2018_I69.PAR.g10884.t1.cds [Oikopleura dioica]